VTADVILGTEQAAELTRQRILELHRAEARLERVVACLDRLLRDADVALLTHPDRSQAQDHAHGQRYAVGQIREAMAA